MNGRLAYICTAVRTPIGRYAGTLSTVRPDDLAALTLTAVRERNPGVDWVALDDVILGCTNQAGEDNRNVARMALLIAGFPESVPGVTVNRLCASGLESVGLAARMIACGDADLVIAGGVESMTRAPFVLAKSAEPFGRIAEVHDTTLGWRFVNRRLEQRCGLDSMIQTAENVARELKISRADQDLFALRSQEKAARAQAEGLFCDEITAVEVKRAKAEPLMVAKDEHPRATSLEKLAALQPLTGEGGSVTAGNSSGINDGASALLLASEQSIRRFGLAPLARVLGIRAAGVPPRLMGLGPVPATRKLVAALGLPLERMDLIELNEAFAAQALACLRELGIPDDDQRVNPLGGAIALGHPLGMSGARLVTTAVHQLRRMGGRYALCTMCVGVGQGVALALESCASTVGS